MGLGTGAGLAASSASGSLTGHCQASVELAVLSEGLAGERTASRPLSLLAGFNSSWADDLRPLFFSRVLAGGFRWFFPSWASPRSIAQHGGLLRSRVSASQREVTGFVPNRGNDILSPLSNSACSKEFPLHPRGGDPTKV